MEDLSKYIRGDSSIADRWSSEETRNTVRKTKAFLFLEYGLHSNVKIQACVCVMPRKGGDLGRQADFPSNVGRLQGGDVNGEIQQAAGAVWRAVGPD